MNVVGPVGTGGVPGADAGSDASSPVVCPVENPARAPMRRLTNFEFNNTVRDLLGDSSRPADQFPADVFPPAADQESVYPLLVQLYNAYAADFAATATKDAASVQALTGCDPVALGEAMCEQLFISAFVPRIFRRAVDPADAGEFGAVFDAGRALGGDFASGVRAVVEVVLQSPEFLYRVEFGEPVDPPVPSVARPTPYEMATRLSYFLWGSAPDDQLLSAAAEGKLRTGAQIADQARRLLGDARAHDVVQYFYFRFLGIAPGDSVAIGQLPGANVTKLADLLSQETRLFIDEVTWQGPGDLATLLTAPVTWLNGPLASFYGISGITGDAFQKVSLNPAQRGGILTQASFLASSGSGIANTGQRAMDRGLLVFWNLLCGQVGSDALRDPAEPPPAFPLPAMPTDRQRLEQRTTSPTCAECHRQFEPLGYAFEHYDSVGLWRDLDNGQPVDATGEIFQTDAKGKFNGAIELVQRLAQSRDVQACFAKAWLPFAYGRQLVAQDACSGDFLVNAFMQASGNVRELLVALTQTNSFLYRPAN